MILLAKISVFIIGTMFLVGMLLQFVRIRSTKTVDKMLAIIFVVGMMLIAYSSWLGEGADLARYYNILGTMRGKSLAWAMENSVYKNTVVVNTFMWLIAQTGINQLLPALSTGIILVNIIYFIRLEAKRDTLEPSTQLSYLIFYFAIASFSSIMTGVRQDWMLSLFAITIHRDVIQKKRDVITILLYVTVCMIHNSALLLVAVRLASLVKGWFRYIFLGWGVLIPYAENYTELEGFFGEAAEKLNNYQGVEDLDVRNIFVRTIIMVVLFVVLCVLRKKEKRNHYYDFMETLMVFCAGSIMVQHVYVRLLSAVGVLSLPLIADFKRRIRGDVWIVFLLFIMVACAGLFAYQITLMRNYWGFR